MFSVENKVIIVTGSSGGNGSAIVDGLKKLGATVLGYDLPLYDITSKSRLETLVSHALNWNGKIDGLINCAGNVVLSSGFDMSSIVGMSNEDIHAIPGSIDGHFLPYMRDVASFYLAGLLIFCLYYFFLRETDDTLHDNGANAKSKKD